MKDQTYYRLTVGFLVGCVLLMLILTGMMLCV